MPNLAQVSQGELEQYRYIPVQKKIDAMEMYLLGKNGYFYNMEEVGEICFKNRNDSYTVSLIHRANGIYSENGRASNKGLYKPGCRFEQTYGYRVTRRDIEEFIRQYEPTGSAYRGVTFEDWLIERAMQAGKNSRQSEQRVAQGPSRQQPPQQTPEQGESGNSNVGETIGAIAALIGIILIFIFRKQIWAFIVKLFLTIVGVGIAVAVIAVIIAVILNAINK